MISISLPDIKMTPMNRSQLIQLINKKKSFLCIGLDTDLSKIPAHLLKAEDPAFEFNRQIIDATHELAVAYKPNLAFYECNGVKGWQSLTKTAQYLKKFDVFTIADAKRGDEPVVLIDADARRIHRRIPAKGGTVRCALFFIRETSL